jgi:hypothetical protein
VGKEFAVVLLHQIGGPFVFASCQRMVDGFRNETIFAEPFTGAPVQQPDRVRRGGAQAALEQGSKQMVIPIPEALLIQPKDEQIGPLDLTDQGAAIIAPGHRIAQRRIEAFQHGGVQQEIQHVIGEAVQHFVQQEIRDVPVVAAEVPDEPGLVRVMA